MMVDQVLANWMETKYLEAADADSGKRSLDQASFRLKRLESAQRRYMNAIKMLTTLRTLIPAGLAAKQPLKIYEPKRAQA